MSVHKFLFITAFAGAMWAFTQSPSAQDKTGTFTQSPSAQDTTDTMPTSPETPGSGAANNKADAAMATEFNSTPTTDADKKAAAAMVPPK